MEGGTGGRQLDGAWCLRQSQIRGRPTAWEHKRTDKLLSYITKINLLYVRHIFTSATTVLSHNVLVLIKLQF